MNRAHVALGTGSTAPSTHSTTLPPRSNAPSAVCPVAESSVHGEAARTPVARARAGDVGAHANGSPDGVSGSGAAAGPLCPRVLPLGARRRGRFPSNALNAAGAPPRDARHRHVVVVGLVERARLVRHGEGPLAERVVLERLDSDADRELREPEHVGVVRAAGIERLADAGLRATGGEPGLEARDGDLVRVEGEVVIERRVGLHDRARARVVVELGERERERLPLGREMRRVGIERARVEAEDRVAARRAEGRERGRERARPRGESSSHEAEVIGLRGVTTAYGSSCTTRACSRAGGSARRAGAAACAPRPRRRARSCR